MTSIRLALFDMDDVVYAYNRPNRIARLSARTGLAPDFIEDRIWGDGFENDAADAGAFPTPESYIEAWRRRLGYPLSVEDWLEARAAGMTPIPETLRVIGRLTAAGLAVAVLTNNGPLVDVHRHRLAPELAAEVGDRFLVSSNFRTRKPDPAIYRAAVDQLGFAAGETVFVDDLAENVEGARVAGLHAVVFCDPPALEADLCRLGCL